MVAIEQRISLKVKRYFEQMNCSKFTTKSASYFAARFIPADALGSVRQLADGAGSITLARSYKPYGEPLSSQGAGATSYAFTGEWQDSYTGLTYLRARGRSNW
jgi:hypothetical protein